MSYILDALRRADSERERGAVPGVHAQPVPLGSADAVRPPASRTWAWISLALATLLALLLAWQLMGRDAGPEVPAMPPPLAATPTPALPAPVPVPVQTAPPPRPTPIAEAAPAPQPVPVPVPVQVAQPAQKPSLPAAATVAAARPRNAASAPAKAVAAAPVGSGLAKLSPAVSASAPARVPTASELPEDIQRGLPTLVVGGASYSQNPENRMLIINGQVLREGDKLGPDLTLEQIRLKEAVLSTKGHRYRIAY
jgi:general secretion pathway protein B